LRCAFSAGFAKMGRSCASMTGIALYGSRALSGVGATKKLPCTPNSMAGKCGHLSGGVENAGARSAICERSAMLIMQWCLPLRRQQAGRSLSDFGLSAAMAGAAHEVSNTKSIESAENRRMRGWAQGSAAIHCLRTVPNNAIPRCIERVFVP